MKKLAFLILEITCILLTFVISGIAQDSVPVEKEPMHRLKFENEFVRLFDVLIPAGKTTKYHTHIFDGVGVRLSNAQAIDETITGEREAFESKYGEVGFGAVSSPETHRVFNSGKSDSRTIFVEILADRNAATAEEFPILSERHVILIDNDRVRVSRLTLKSGEETKMHTHQMYSLGIVLYDSKIELVSSDGTKQKLKPKVGDYSFQKPGTTHIIKNTGSKVFEVIEIELKLKAAKQ